MKYSLSYDPYEFVESLLLELSKKQRDVIVRRFGLGSTLKKKTLEEIGEGYNITRERVRQIEEAALSKILEGLAQYRQFLSIFEDYLAQRENIVAEQHLFDDFAGDDKRLKNYINFLLVVGEGFDRKREDEHLHHRWFTSADAEQIVRASMKDAVLKLRKEDRIFTKDEIENIVLTSVRSVVGRKVSNTALEAWLRLTKLITKNEFDEWGLADSPLVNPRGVRDYSYLVLRKLKEPMHFTDVAKNIRLHLRRPAQPQTVHNELIKDKRFVLVGRGLYGLSEWGYEPGFVKDVIGRILEQRGALSTEEIMETVLKQRRVKPNTILINLKNKKFFTRLPDDRYKLSR